MIIGANYELDLITVHLRNEEEAFFQVPKINDNTENWQRLQEWLDSGNKIGPQLFDQAQYVVDKRRISYPSWEEQLDYIYHNGVDAWKSDMIDPIKAKYPKP